MEPQADYIINPHYQEWAIDLDTLDDLHAMQEAHTHAWHLEYDILPDTDPPSVVLYAWCECGSELSQDEIEAVLKWGKP